MRSILVVLSVLACVVRTEKTITVDARDSSIHYNPVATDSTNGNYSTWALESASPTACSTIQMITERLGESMTFTFNGTGVSVIGTIGRKRGYINFTLDDGPQIPYDRSNAALVCDTPIFTRMNLPYGPHTVVATLVGEAIDYSNNVYDAVLSVQRIQYFIPGSNSPSVGVIGGSVVAAIFFIAFLVGVGLYLLRRRSQRTPTQGFTRRDPIDLNEQYSPKPHTPMMVATPFEWPEPSYGSRSPISRPGSQQTLMDPNSNPYFPTPSSSGSDSNPNSRRESAPLMMNPDRTSIGSRERGDEDLVGRIATRVADMIQSRGGMDGIVPPPLYQHGGPSRPVYTMEGQGLYPPEKGGAAPIALGTPTPPLLATPSPEQLPHPGTLQPRWVPPPGPYTAPSAHGSSGPPPS